MGRTLNEDDVLKEIDRWIGYLDEDMITRIKISIKKIPSAQPYTEDEIQKMQDLEQAQLDKAYELGRQSAQPEPIRCKDCKWYELPSHKIYENCVRWMKRNGILLPIKPNDYCCYAERREDEKISD